MEEYVYDRRTLLAAKRALDRLNPKRLSASAYVDAHYATQGRGIVCARGALYVSERTRGATERLSPQEIGQRFGGHFDKMTPFLIDAKKYDKATVDALEDVNQHRNLFGLHALLSPFDDETRFKIVYAWIESRLEREEAYRKARTVVAGA